MNWSQFLKKISLFSPLLEEGLRSAPNQDDIDQLNALISTNIPQEARQILEQHDGQHVGGRILFTLILMRASEIEKYIKSQGQQYIDIYGVRIDARIQSRSVDQSFLPLFTDDTGNYLGVDLNPTTEGLFGQVVVFGADIDEPYVISKNLDALFGTLSEYIESERVELRQEFGYPYLYLRDSYDTLLADLLF